MRSDDLVMTSEELGAKDRWTGLNCHSVSYKGGQISDFGEF